MMAGVEFGDRHRLISTGQGHVGALLTAVSAVRRDCKEKEELIQRVLESSIVRRCSPISS